MARQGHLSLPNESFDGPVPLGALQDVLHHVFCLILYRLVRPSLLLSEQVLELLARRCIAL